MGMDPQADATTAAHAAGVRIEIARDTATMRGVDDLYAKIWGTDAAPVDVLRSIEHAGGAVHAAYEDDTLVGASVALFCPPSQRAVYSMIAGTIRPGGGIGYALKQAQRAWALDFGATTMRWTFDPLVARNARFNLTKLGAVVHEYAIDFYGQIGDAVQGNDPTDRLTAEWHLDAPVGRGDSGGPRAAYGAAPDGGPLQATDGETLWCRVPDDIVALRRTDAVQASAWRLAVREVLQPALAQGLTATGVTRDGWYRLERL